MRLHHALCLDVLLWDVSFLQSTISMLQNQEHTCFFRFQSELHESLTPLQFAKALALKNINSVSIWSMLGLLTGEGSRPNGLQEAAQNRPLALQGKEAAVNSISPTDATSMPAYASMPPLNSAVAIDRSQETSGTSSGESILDWIYLTMPAHKNEGTLLHQHPHEGLTCLLTPA